MMGGIRRRSVGLFRVTFSPTKRSFIPILIIFFTTNFISNRPFSRDVLVQEHRLYSGIFKNSCRFISTNQPRRPSCPTFGRSQSQWSFSINPRRWLAATKSGTSLTSRSIRRYVRSRGSRASHFITPVPAPVHNFKITDGNKIESPEKYDENRKKWQKSQTLKDWKLTLQIPFVTFPVFPWLFLALGSEPKYRRVLMTS